MAKARPLSRTSRAKARPKVTDNAYGPARAERVTQDPLAARLLTDLLAESARRHPRRIALIYYSRQISYSGLWQDVTYCASGLQALGVRRGDRVALMSQNCPQFVIAYFGALRAGAIVTPTSPIYTAREAAHQWHDAGAKIVIVERSLLPIAEAARATCPHLEQVIVFDERDYRRGGAGKTRAPLGRGHGALALRRLGAAAAPVTGPGTWVQLMSHGHRPRRVALTPGAVACLQYTGGTTGTSKGAMLTHANLSINAAQANAWAGAEQGGRNGAGPVWIGVLPLFHIFAQTCVMICALRVGGCVVILPRFELKTALQAVKRHRPTYFHGVPTIFLAMSDAPNARRYGLSSLRMCLSGGAALPVEVAQRFESVTGARLVEGYGLTETSPVTHINPLDGTARKGSIGKVIARTAARIVDVETGTREMPLGEAGEILIRGPQVMKGYWRKPAETAEVLRRGWLHTGDIARRDAEGYFYIVDRKKDVVIAGGYNVYPREVEEVLFEHPRVKEAVVVGVADRYRGETVKAFVVLKAGPPGVAASNPPGPRPPAADLDSPDSPAALQADIQAFCRERLAAYKVPRLVEFRDSLPKSGVGKYLRRELRAEAAAQAAGAGAAPSPAPAPVPGRTSADSSDPPDSPASDPKPSSPENP